MGQGDDKKKILNIGMLGCGFMGKVHSHAYSVIPYIFDDISIKPILYAVSGRRESTLKSFARKFEYQKYSTNWKDIVDEAHVDIIDICLPEYLHEEACIYALQAGKHIICEKPLALSIASCRNIVEKASISHFKTMSGFNYRFLPAIRLAKEILQKGLLKQIYYITASYFQESGHDPLRPADQIRYVFGQKQLGSVRGIGSHVIDIVRFLVGEIISVNALFRTFNKLRRTSEGVEYPVDADEVSTMLVEFASGAVGTLTASAVSTGRKNRMTFEIYGSSGSIAFNLDNPNYLYVYMDEIPHSELRGFTAVNVTEKIHPLTSGWWPAGHNLGWEHAHINQLKYFLECVSENKEVAPYGATFQDGLRAAEIAELAYYSNKEGKKIIL